MFSQKDLSPEQLDIIKYQLHHDLYVEAPAGYGKTSTAMLKAGEVAKRLVDSPHQRVLVLTFSKMAVRQIDEEKQQHVLKTLHSRIVIKTYHAFYFDLIRHYAHYLGFEHSHFDLLTPQERKALYDLFCVSHRGLEYEAFSYAQYLDAAICAPMPIDGHPSCELVQAAASLLQDYHKQEHRLGFEDFPYYAYRILADSSFICHLLASKYPFIFLDEFQNTNDLQWTILKRLIPEVKLVVFADPKQTIHVFRGAGKVIERFKEERNPHPIPLTENFRNPASLYAFAQGIATGKFDALPPENVSFHRFRLYEKEKWNLKFHIQELRKVSGSSVRSIAILTKENKQVAELSDFLGRKTEKTPAICHQVVSDDFRVQDEENIVLSLFQLIYTCDLHHLTVLASALAAGACGNSNYPFYLGQAFKSGQCRPDVIARKNECPGAKNASAVLKILQPFVQAGVPGGPQEAWQRTERVIEDLSRIRSIPNLTQVCACLKNEWILLSSSKGLLSPQTYLRHLMAKRRRQNFLEQRSYAHGIFVMTLHQSQGKQFDAVFIWRCNDGIIPHPDEINKGDTSPSQHLLYVGITRAKRFGFVRIYYEQNDHVQPSRLIQPFLS
jgi:DNA helicase-2/ATP-dependent DNA helicase PcrA